MMERHGPVEPSRGPGFPLPVAADAVIPVSSYEFSFGPLSRACCSGMQFSRLSSSADSISITLMLEAGHEYLYKW
jgi:hypothetical protein